MVATKSKSSVSRVHDEGSLPFDVTAASEAAEALLRMQRVPWDLMMACQKSMAATQQELWDQWTSHWAGGVPLDG